MAEPRSILLVEDEVVVLRMVADIIEHLGYKVIAASAPEEALHRISERGEVVDLLVTDIIMPEMSGVDFIRAVRANDQTKHLPVIMDTANNETDVRYRALEFQFREGASPGEYERVQTFYDDGTPIGVMRRWPGRRPTRCSCA